MLPLLGREIHDETRDEGERSLAQIRLHEYGDQGDRENGRGRNEADPEIVDQVIGEKSAHNADENDSASGNRRDMPLHPEL